MFTSRPKPLVHEPLSLQMGVLPGPVSPAGCFLPPAPRVVSAESGWSAGPGPPLSPARPPSQPSSPSARPHRDGTDESPWLTADSGGRGTDCYPHLLLLLFNPGCLTPACYTPLPVSYLFSGPDAALELLPQPAEAVVPPPGLLVLLQPAAQLLY